MVVGTETRRNRERDPVDKVTLRVQRLSHAADLPLPEQASAGSAGLDLRAAVAEDLLLAPGERTLVPTGLVLELPRGWEGQVRPRSGLAIRNGILYANNVNDLVGINISDLTDIEVVERLANVYQVTGSDFPENYIGYFECVDPNLGQVVGWFETTIREPECWRE